MLSTLGYFLLLAMTAAFLVTIGESCFKFIEWLIVFIWNLLKMMWSCRTELFKRSPKPPKPLSAAEIAIKRLSPGRH